MLRIVFLITFMQHNKILAGKDTYIFIDISEFLSWKSI